jgi:aspartyl/glutamyl-tRNA(Asn/Gln) amidotransferase, C subunit
MRITKDEVRHVAELARLNLSDAEEDRMTDQLNAILTYVTKLDELDTTGVAVTTHTQPVTNAFREDIVCPSLPREKGLANGPKQNGESFVVPRIIG